MVVNDTVAGISREAVERLSSTKNEPAWLLEKRLHAWETFEAIPMPSRTDEGWRRTDLRGLNLANLTLFAGAGSGEVESPLQLDGNEAGLLVQQNAEAVKASLQDDLAAQGVILSSLEAAVRDHPKLVQAYLMTDAVLANHDKFAALNGGLWSGGAFLYVPANVEVAVPLRALYGLNTDGSALFTHTLVVAEPNSRVTFLEEYTSGNVTSPSLNAGVVEMFVKDGAHVTFVALQEWMGQVYDLSTQRAVVDRNGRLDWLVIGLGNGITRTSIEAALRGAGASTQMLGILWGYGSQSTDYHTMQDHIAPHTTSDLLYKGALTDEAKSIYAGTIRVSKGAMGTDAYQANRSILLSSKASAYPSPNLEIEANEVRCTHGATVGKVDQDQLFYLMARGIDKRTATRMIVEGFFEDVLQREPVESIRANLRDLIARKMDLG